MVTLKHTNSYSILIGVYADYARIRQGDFARLLLVKKKLTNSKVLMNLIGNAVKFTASGYVRVNCSAEQVVQSMGSSDPMALLKFEILSVNLLPLLYMTSIPTQ